jgi:Pvc16 N-terminal domain
MIEQIDNHLKGWISSILEGVSISLAPPTRGTAGAKTVGLYLLELANVPPPRTNLRPPLQMGLRYLITVWSESPEDDHRMLGELAFSAMADRRFEVHLEPPLPEVWVAFGVPPMPSFILQATVEVEQPTQRAPLVRSAPVIRNAPLRSLRGLVTGSGDIPLVGERVEVSGLRQSVYTDSQGQFFITALDLSETSPLRVTVRNQEFSVAKQANSIDGKDLLIHLETQEI